MQFAILDPGGTAQRLEGTAPLPEGEFEILTCYYRFAIQDTATGRAFLRLRAVLQ